MNTRHSFPSRQKKAAIAAALALAAFGAGPANATTLAYEDFRGSVSGAGDDYEYDATIRSASDTRTGFTGSWDNPPAIAGSIDYDSRDANMSYNNLIIGGNGVLEIYENRSGRSDTNRGIDRSLSYTTPNSGDLYFTFGWSDSTSGSISFNLAGTRAQSFTVNSTGVVTSGMDGASADNFNSQTDAGKTAFTDGSWNLLVLRVRDVNGSFYDDVDFFLNPTLAGDGTLGAADFTGSGIFTEHDLNDGSRQSFTSVQFNAAVGTGDSAQFDEFGIFTDTADFLVVPEASPALLGGLGTLLLLRRRRAS